MSVSFRRSSWLNAAMRDASTLDRPGFASRIAALVASFLLAAMLGLSGPTGLAEFAATHPGDAYSARAGEGLATGADHPEKSWAGQRNQGHARAAGAPMPDTAPAIMSAAPALVPPDRVDGPEPASHDGLHRAALGALFDTGPPIS